MIDIDLAALKASAGVSVLAAVGRVAGSVPVFEVPWATVAGACAGSLLAFAYAPPVESRKRMLGYAVGGVFIGVWGVKLLQWRGIDVPDDVAPAVAGAIALVSQRIMPLLLENLPAFGMKLLSLGKKP